MRLHELTPASKRKDRKRVGRGTSSGHGKTAGRGTKGQLSRSGGGKGPGFEGGQTPLQRRVPKLPGFKNPFKKVYSTVNVAALEKFDPKSTVGPEELKGARLIKKTDARVKILGNGDITRPLTVVAHAFSATAERKITQAKGKVEVIR